LVPHVFGTEGEHLGRWPTNASEVPNALKDLACWTTQPTPPCGPEGGIGGEMRPSGDFTHYFFSPGNFQFAPGGQTTGMTSVYDNNTVTGTVTVASVLNDGSPIPKEPGVTSDDYMALPAASDDGSHILMAASGTGICGKSTCAPMPLPCGWSDGGGFKNGIAIGECPPLLPSHLYMRVNGSVTYDVSDGHQVDFKAMTPDGTHVFFTSTEQPTADDHDSGIDLFMWSEATDSIRRVSAGAGTVGDSDACNASWIARCGVEIASPHYTYFETKPTDNVVSSGGDVYFYSPEQFVGSNGIPGRRNLYVLHQGELEYVATLEPSQSATRFEVSPNGRWAAFITASKLTPYDNQGKEEMYRFDADTGDLRCVSCLPSGEPPQNNVEGSQDGLFLTDDGRAFFATRDQLVPQDTDGVTDVYEYVAGAARLITDGIAPRDETRFGKVGLVGVSNDGTDAYFSTLQTLVPEDANGAFLKFYDARVNGGFPTSSVAAPCAAADECHGDGNAALAPLRLGSTADLGSAGNVHRRGHRKHRHRTHRRHHHRKHRSHGKHKNGKKRHRHHGRPGAR
jgi:hypothetical protein